VDDAARDLTLRLAEGWPGRKHEAGDVRLRDIFRNVPEYEVREKFIDATVRSDSAPRMPKCMTPRR